MDDRTDGRRPRPQLRSSMRRMLPVLVLALLAAACGSGGDDPDVVAAPTPITASPASASPIATPSAEPSDDLSPTPTPSVDPSASPEPRDATDTDRARFVAGYQPEGAAGLEHVAVDVTGDGVEELVFSYVRSGEGVSHVDIAVWDGTGYAVAGGADGGKADRVDDVRIGDVNRDGAVEVVVFETAGSSAASLTIWGVTEEAQLVPQRGQGGCNDGRHTFGVVGAELEDRDGNGSAEIYASCDLSPAPVSAWPSDVYRWVDGAWRHDPFVEG